jgi:hypothetical protein
MSVAMRPLRHVTSWCSTTTWGAARWQRVLAAVVTAVIFWPQSSLDAIIGLDPSWQAGLALVRIHHLSWGPEVIFNYGPLGFLQTTAYYSFDQSLLASIYQLTVVAALFLGIAAALRQRHAPLPSIIGAFITTGITAILHIGHGSALGMMYPELVVLAALAWAAVPLLQHDPAGSTVFRTCGALGAVAGLQLLVKFNIGVTIVAIALAVSVLLDWRAVGRHCATVIAFAASAFICWLLAGQRPEDLPAWLRYSASIVSGYSAAMATPLPALGPFAIEAVVPILAWIGALCVMFVRGGPGIPRRFVALIGLATLITAKKEFIRLGLGNFCAVLALVVVAVAITPCSRASRRGFVLVVGAIVLLAVSSEHTFRHAHGGDARDRIVAAAQAPAQAVDRLMTLALPGHVDQRVGQAKARQRALYAIPGSFIKTIGSGTIHIDPDETSAAWAYDLAWRPAPVFQTYQANTPTLDQLNGESLSTGPQFVLSRRSPASPATSIDGRLGVEESPRYSRALLCDYTVSGVENRWALFSHTGPHCGQLTALSQVPVRENDVIKVPAPSGPGMAVLVGIDLQPTVVDRLFQGTVVPLTIPTIVLDGVSYRLIAANAAEPFLINAPASVDGTNLQIHAHTIGVGRAPSLGQSDVAARLRFYEMRVAP